MSVDQVSLLLALLSIMAIAIGLGSSALVLTCRSERARPVASLLVPLAFAVALTATLGSLYYSGIAHFRPCRLCWWQRIMMYPLVPILAIATIKRDRVGALYALPLTGGGLGYAAYHTQLRWFPDQGSSCEAEAACTSVWVNTFGFISIPFMAGAGFLAIFALLALHLRLAHTKRARALPTPAANLQSLVETGATPMTSTSAAQTAAPNKALPIAAGLLIATVIVAALVAIGSGGDPADDAITAASRIPEDPPSQVSFAAIDGAPLPRFEAGTVDQAIGMNAPPITASYFDDTETTIEFGDGHPRIILFLAHW